MAKIKIAVAGCLGRMGQELSKQIIKNNKLEFVGGFEHKKHKDINKQFKNVTDIDSTKIIDSTPINSIKIANVLIDFTTPQSTLENVKIASQNKTAVLFWDAILTFSRVDWGVVKSIKTFAILIELIGVESIILVESISVTFLNCLLMSLCFLCSKPPTNSNLLFLIICLDNS